MKRKGKILHVRFGLNPNSSSLGANLGMLLIGAATLTLLVNLTDAGLRIWLKKRRSGAGENR
jgi:hypothetical protein